MVDQTFIVGPLPPGVAPPATAADRAVYRKALDLEGVFTQHLVDAMMQSASRTTPIRARVPASTRRWRTSRSTRR